MSDILYQCPLHSGQFITLGEKPKFKYHSIKQVHGTNILPINQQTPHLSLSDSSADGLVSKLDHGGPLPMLIVTADCLPIFFEGPGGISLIHAGWRGLAQGILSNPILQEINPQQIVIGPHICTKHYEVGEDFKSNFPQDTASFIHHNKQVFFDMNSFVTEKIKSIFKSAKIISNAPCTFCDDSFHSYRRNKTKSRNYNLYIPNDALDKLRL